MFGLPVVAALILQSAATDPRLLRAIELYETVEFAKADEGLQALVADPSLPKTDTVTAWKYLAAVRFAQAKVDAADKALDELVRFDSSARLEANMFDPALIARHEAALKRAAEFEAAHPEPAQPVLPPAHVERAQPEARPVVVPVVAIVSGAALQGFGIYSLGNILARNGDFVAAQDAGQPAPFSREAAQRDRGMYPVAIASTAVGALLTAYGIYALASSPSPSSPSVSIAAGTDGAAFSVSGSF